MAKRQRISKQQNTNNEIKFVEHMEQILKDGLRGNKEKIVIGEEPIRRFFSGVLFPDIEFMNQVNEEDEENDPQPQFKSLAKNCNMGLEFLVDPNKVNVRGTISGKFNLYPRFFPTFLEQSKSFEYLINSESEDNPQSKILDDINKVEAENIKISSNDTKRTNEQNKGLKLLEKYEQTEVCFNDLPFEIDFNELEQQNIPLKEILKEEITQLLDREDLFSVYSNVIEKTGAVPLLKKPETEEEFKDMLEGIKESNTNIANWDANLVIDPVYYKDKLGNNLLKINISLLNDTKVPDITIGEKTTGHPTQFFDCFFEVKIQQGKHIPFYFDGAIDDYKYDKRYNVKGINCVGIYKENDTDSELTLSTETIPSYFQEHYRTREDLSVAFEDLTTPKLVDRTLSNVVLEMKNYLRKWKDFIDYKGDEEKQLITEEEISSCTKDMKEFEEEIDSFELGIYALKMDSRLMTAFNIMNKVFMESGKGKYTSWRLFQIIFIVRILPSLYAREMPETDSKKEEIATSAKYADVLWFPTGGGKTEAYLGLVVTALFYDRLRGKKRGCSSWIRFPLRMLSKNQLDRLAKMLIYAEEYRQKSDEIPSKGKPFSIGFFAGGSNTDNFVKDNMRKKYFENEISKKRKMLLHKCPRCDKNLKLEFNESLWRFEHQCTNQECFVVKSKELNGVVPIYITDSEVYRFVPSVLCGTVDKLAIMGRYREFSHIFGQIGGTCNKHGFYSDRCIVGAYDEYLSCSEKVKNTAKHKGDLLKKKDSFYDPVPSLFIQDELHLLKEELGALNGHYEGALNEFARSFGRKPDHLPKIIAATATIESYEHHINHLYLRAPRKYPSMGFKKGESFYATSTPTVKRRLYLGILPHSRSQEEVIGRSVYLYQKEIRNLHYKSSYIFKEFGFEGIDCEEDFLELLSKYDLSTVYVNQKAMGLDIARRMEEIKDPEFSIQTEMLTGDNDMDKIIDVIDKIESQGGRVEYKNKLQLLIATSLISHGVDLERINSFFMAGMPSKQAEYIQASSRSARSHAGLVLVSFRANDLRERSQYQFFIQNHTFMDRLVDPVPINRLSLKAIERTLPGLLSSLLLNVHSQKQNKTIYNCGLFQQYIADRVTSGDSVSKEIIEQLERIYGAGYEYFSLTARERVKETIERIYREKEHLLNTSSKTLKFKDEQVLNPISSFRDIEEGLTIQSCRETDVILRYALPLSERIGK
ncbi:MULTISPECIES: helicase-related protein [Bacillus]|nr:helicase-related protein [Bacillus cereus]KGT40523.1 hypothetical protein IY08_29705 [Bacillus cereus]PET54899.1 hypothetical protein CN536_29975 [Bacillus cereus]PFR78041.1 hypothetical protein COK40_04820 [Bacillus cereus]